VAEDRGVGGGSRRRQGHDRGLRWSRKNDEGEGLMVMFGCGKGRSGQVKTQKWTGRALQEALGVQFVCINIGGKVISLVFACRRSWLW
jgi:hypothetical protein